MIEVILPIVLLAGFVVVVVGLVGVLITGGWE